jgi:GNAT superfamily N-acetyltransferase
MTLEVTTRPASISDAEAIARLTRQLGYDVETRDVEDRLSRLLARRDQQFVIAEHDGRSIGWVNMILVEYVETGAFVTIGGLVVDREYRGQGIGRRLLTEAEQWAAQQGCAIVRLSSSATRTEAHKFYEHVGYMNVKTQLSFAKPLNGPARDALRRFVPDVS